MYISLLTPTAQGGAGCARGELVPLPTQESTVDFRELDREEEFGFNVEGNKASPYSLAPAWSTRSLWSTETPVTPL